MANTLSSVAEPATPVIWSWALSMRLKLHVPDGWCSSGLRANEYTLTPEATAGTQVWCWYGCTCEKYLPGRAANLSWPLSLRLTVEAIWF